MPTSSNKTSEVLTANKSQETFSGDKVSWQEANF
jgi:hypothetical protein